LCIIFVSENYLQEKLRNRHKFQVSRQNKDKRYEAGSRKKNVYSPQTTDHSKEFYIFSGNDEGDF
jgi:hypothetical protein